MKHNLDYTVKYKGVGLILMLSQKGENILNDLHNFSAFLWALDAARTVTYGLVKDLGEKLLCLLRPG